MPNEKIIFIFVINQNYPRLPGLTDTSMDAFGRTVLYSSWVFVHVLVSLPHVVQAWAVGPWVLGSTVWSTWSYFASSGRPSASSLQVGSTAYLACGDQTDSAV